jgi:hypothetical protein
MPGTFSDGQPISDNQTEGRDRIMSAWDDMTQDEREQHEATVQFARAALASMQIRQYAINEAREKMEAREQANTESEKATQP